MKSLKTTLWLMFLPAILFFYAAAMVFFFLEEHVWWKIWDRLTRPKGLKAQLFLARLPEEEFEQGLEEFRAMSIAQGCSPEETDATIRLLREQKRDAGSIV